jgi:hypothetical protein
MRKPFFRLGKRSTEWDRAPRVAYVRHRPGDETRGQGSATNAEPAGLASYGRHGCGGVGGRALGCAGARETRTR